MQSNLNDVLAHYLAEPSSATSSPLGNGHINQTFLIDAASGKFVLQQINHHVFPQPQWVVDNAVLIDQFLSADSSDYRLATIAPIRSLAGNYLELIDGGYWRAFEFIAGCTSVETIDQPQQAFQAAQTFANFSRALATFDATKLQPVIEKFHDINHRLAQFERAIGLDSVGRVRAVEDFIAEITNQTQFITDVNNSLKQQPLRVTHNDTKINNLLFNQATMAPYAVIDLDTCMAGYLLHDFGDMVRTCCSSLSEDATDLAQMTFKRDIYAALYQGYLDGAKGMISASEIKALPLGGCLMPFLLTLRFLTDYLDGDNYFSIDHPSHNLERAKNQFQLYKLLSQQLLG